MRKVYFKSFKTLFVTATILLCSVTSSAHNFEVDGIFYDITSSRENTVSVTYKGQKDYTIVSDDYSGDVIIPESVTYDGITYSVTGIRGYTFYKCNNLQSVTIPSSITAIGNDAFSTCGSIKSVIIPNSVTSIGDWAFVDCNSLTNITIPNSVTSIGEYAFSRCYSITSITIPNSVTSIGKRAFYECKGLTSVTLSNSVTSIGEFAFAGCNLTNVTIPNCIQTIADGTFYGCKGLTSVAIPNSVTTIGNKVFYECTGLTNITILNNVKTIGEQAFYRCEGLTSVTLPNSLTTIGKHAFYDCDGLTSVTIGCEVDVIGGYAFCSCSNLNDVYCFATTPPSLQTGWRDIFERHETLHVPEEAVDLYKTTEPWNKFKTIIAIDDIETKVCAIPQVSYSNGSLSIDCETQGAVFITEITSNDISEFYDKNINLSATYNISVYAAATNHKDSETINATLCWVEMGAGENDTETSIINIPTVAALITSINGTISVKCPLNGEDVAVYTINGVLVGTTTIENGLATIDTGLSKGTIAIIKIGEKSVKVILQ